MTDATVEIMDDNETRNDDVDHVFTELEGIAAMWAHHGLTMGKMALRASAISAERGAKLLGRLASRFEERVEQRTDA